MTTVSYIIALYNKEKYIVEAIESALADNSNSYEIQICIVDDGSTDKSLRIIVDKYAKDERVIIDSFPKNKGKVAAYNRAFELSSGDYIAIFGADDKVILGRTSAMIKLAKATKKSIYGGLIKYMEATGEEIVMRAYLKANFNKNIIENKFSGGASLIKRSDCNSIFPIPPDLGFEDWWISFHLLRINSVALLDQPVTLYRIHEGNDCGVATMSYESMARDYDRHLICLYKFEPYLESIDSKLYQQRAIAIRKSFFGERQFYNLLRPPFGKSWVVLVLFNIFGAKTTIAIHKFRKKATALCVNKLWLKKKR